MTRNYVEPQILTGGERGNVERWSLKTGGRLQNYKGCKATTSMSGVAFSTLSTRVIAGATDDTIRVWKSDTGEELPPLGRKPGARLAEYVLGLCLVPSEFKVLSASGDGVVRLWNLETEELE